MTTKRRKAAASAAPQTIAEATALLARFAELDRGIEEIEAAADRRIAAAKLWRDLEAQPLLDELKQIFNRLKPWWKVAGEALTDGQRKSIALAGCQIGHRTTTPRLAVPAGREAEIIEHLEFLGFAQWAIRVRKELDKPAIIRALAHLGAADALGEDAAALAGLGLSVQQREEFFIARLKPQAPPVEEVPEALPEALREVPGGQR